MSQRRGKSQLNPLPPAPAAPEPETTAADDTNTANGANGSSGGGPALSDQFKYLLNGMRGELVVAHVRMAEVVTRCSLGCDVMC